MQATPSSSLLLYAGNQIFSAASTQSLFVGTHPPADFPGFVFQYKHPNPFGVAFRFDGRIWYLSHVQNVSHQSFRCDNATYVGTQHSKEGYRRDSERFIPTWPLAAGLRLGAGLHVFWYDRHSEKSFDQFRVSILEDAFPVEDADRIEFTTEAQRSYERRAFFQERMANAAAEGELDPYNVELLKEDLKDRLERPKKANEGARLLLSPDGNLRAVWNQRTGKIVGVLDRTDDLAGELKTSADIVVFPLEFSEFTHRLDQAFSLSMMNKIPLPDALLRAIDLFNQRVD